MGDLFSSRHPGIKTWDFLSCYHVMASRDVLLSTRHPGIKTSCKLTEQAHWPEPSHFLAQSRPFIPAHCCAPWRVQDCTDPFEHPQCKCPADSATCHACFLQDDLARLQSQVEVVRALLLGMEVCVVCSNHDLQAVMRSLPTPYSWASRCMCRVSACRSYSTPYSWAFRCMCRVSAHRSYSTRPMDHSMCTKNPCAIPSRATTSARQ